METIFRLDTNDPEKINRFMKALKKARGKIVIPQGDHVKVYIVSDTGKVTEI